jgi:hypothetical protein
VRVSGEDLTELADDLEDMQDHLDRQIRRMDAIVDRTEPLRRRSRPRAGARCGLVFVHRWSALNERQCALLERLAAGEDPAAWEPGPGGRRSAHALRDRGLLNVTRAGGRRVRRPPRPAASTFDTVVILTPRPSRTVPTRRCPPGLSRLRQAAGGGESQAEGAAHAREEVDDSFEPWRDLITDVRALRLTVHDIADGLRSWRSTG